MCRALVLAVAVSALSQAVWAYPKLWSEMEDTCKGPSRGYKGHKSPQPDGSMRFKLFMEDGTPVATYEPGESYLLNVTYPLLGNTYLHTTAGAFGNGIDPRAGKPVKKQGCNLRAWYSNELWPVQVKSVNWVAPSCCASADSVTIQATFGSGPTVHLRQAEVVIKKQKTRCSCYNGAHVPAPSDEAPKPAPKPAPAPSKEAAPELVTEEAPDRKDEPLDEPEDKVVPEPQVEVISDPADATEAVAPSEDDSTQTPEDDAAESPDEAPVQAEAAAAVGGEAAAEPEEVLAPEPALVTQDAQTADSVELPGGEPPREVEAVQPAVVVVDSESQTAANDESDEPLVAIEPAPTEAKADKTPAALLAVLACAALVLSIV